MRINSVTAAVLLGTAASLLQAQPGIPVKPGQVSYQEGQVYVDDRLVQATADRAVQVNRSSVVRTGAGRAEVVLGPCTVLRLAENSAFRLSVGRLLDTRLDLLAGSAIIQSNSKAASDAGLTIHLKEASISIAPSGLYRFDLAPPRVKVFSGRADVERQPLDFLILVGSGRMLTLDGGETAAKFDKRILDPLDEWSKARIAIAAARQKSSCLAR